MRRTNPSILLIPLLLVPLLLTACSPQGLTNSADAALMRSAQGMAQGQQAVIDRETFQVRQTIQAAGRTFGLISYNQMTQGRQEECLMMLEIQRTFLGWSSRGGAGGCSSMPEASGEQDEAQMQKQPMDVGGGSGSSGPNDTGYSHVNGMVNQPEIKRVRVRWSDNQTTETDVKNETYAIVRPGQVRFNLVEGLNENGVVIFSHKLETAPGKN